MQVERNQLLIIGAGPYGIATAAYAKCLGLPVTIVGKTLDFWKTNMPRGMFLRSVPDWQIDARGVATFEAYVNAWAHSGASQTGAARSVSRLCELVYGTV
jgi:cation diffusion facilitator CzcD-associated flavoprotein CzcO